MRRRTLDILVSAGGALLAILLLVAGLVLTSDARFAYDYVKSQLGQQNITFKAEDTLTPEEKAKPCLVEYAGQNDPALPALQKQLAEISAQRDTVSKARHCGVCC